MATAKTNRKAVVSNNLRMRMMVLEVDGTAGTPAATGLDSSQVTSVTDTGTGDYTIALKFPFNSEVGAPTAIVSSLTAGVQAYVTAVSASSITVEGVDTTDGSTATDCDFSIVIVGCDNRFKY